MKPLTDAQRQLNAIQIGVLQEVADGQIPDETILLPAGLLEWQPIGGGFEMGPFLTDVGRAALAAALDAAEPIAYSLAQAIAEKVREKPLGSQCTWVDVGERLRHGLPDSPMGEAIEYYLREWGLRDRRALRERDSIQVSEAHEARRTAVAEAQRLREPLHYLADPENWQGDPHDQEATLYGHDTPFELAVAALQEARG